LHESSSQPRADFRSPFKSLFREHAQEIDYSSQCGIVSAGDGSFESGGRGFRKPVVLDIANSHLLGSEEECEQLDRLIPSREIPTVFIGKESVSGREPADENISVFGKLDGVSAGDDNG
jgi:hypothetical protein